MIKTADMSCILIEVWLVDLYKYIWEQCNYEAKKDLVVLNDVYNIFFEGKIISNTDNKNVVYLKDDEFFIVKVYFLDGL